MPTVHIKVTAGDGVQYSVVMDHTDVNLTNGEADVDVSTGDHHLGWYMAGSPGGSLDISLTEGGRTLVDVKGSKVPSNSGSGFDYRPFTV